MVWKFLSLALSDSCCSDFRLNEELKIMERTNGVRTRWTPGDNMFENARQSLENKKELCGYSSFSIYARNSERRVEGCTFTQMIF